MSQHYWAAASPIPLQLLHNNKSTLSRGGYLIRLAVINHRCLRGWLTLYITDICIRKNNSPTSEPPPHVTYNKRAKEGSYRVTAGLELHTLLCFLFPRLPWFPLHLPTRLCSRTITPPPPVLLSCLSKRTETSPGLFNWFCPAVETLYIYIPWEEEEGSWCVCVSGWGEQLSPLEALFSSTLLLVDQAEWPLSCLHALQRLTLVWGSVCRSSLSLFCRQSCPGSCYPPPYFLYYLCPFTTSIFSTWCLSSWWRVEKGREETVSLPRGLLSYLSAFLTLSHSAILENALAHISVIYLY